jgi:hypothetical protein
MAKKRGGISADQRWVFHTLELLCSPAWRGRSVNCMRLLEFLEIQHLQHGGYENGHLIATFDQLVAFGIGRRFISDTIAEAENRRLVVAEKHARLSLAKSNPTTFRLTYLHTRAPNGKRLAIPPTDEWKAFAEKTESKCTKVNHRQTMKPQKSAISNENAISALR